MHPPNDWVSRWHMLSPMESAPNSIYVGLPGWSLGVVARSGRSWRSFITAVSTSAGTMQAFFEAFASNPEWYLLALLLSAGSVALLARSSITTLYDPWALQQVLTA